MLRWGKNNEAYLNCWYGPYPKHSKWKKPITYQWGHWVQTFLWSLTAISYKAEDKFPDFLLSNYSTTWCWRMALTNHSFCVKCLLKYLPCKYPSDQLWLACSQWPFLTITKENKI